MANLRSLFTRSSGGSGTTRLDLGLPPPPTTREMLDDIERCDDNDPVMLFAKQLNKEAQKNSRTQQLGGGGVDSDEFSNDEEDQFSDAKEEFTAVRKPRTGPHKNGHQRIKFPPLPPNFLTSVNQLASAAYPRNISQEQILHTSATYNRLRTLLGLLESSETLFEEIGPKFKKLDAEAKDFLESWKNAQAQVQQQHVEGQYQDQHQHQEEQDQDQEDSLL